MDTPTFNLDGSVNRTIPTLALTKRQALAVGGTLDVALQMKLMKELIYLYMNVVTISYTVHI